jgi:ferritin-like metal-binding protein YciE
MAHYGMARYGTMAAWAKAIGNDEAAQVLQQMLEANKSADQHLNELANATLNPQAARGEAGDNAQPADGSNKSGKSKTEAA